MGFIKSYCKVLLIESYLNLKFVASFSKHIDEGGVRSICIHLVENEGILYTDEIEFFSDTMGSNLYDMFSELNQFVKGSNVRYEEAPF